MRKYIDCIHVTDIDLAYIITEALEKDDNYSVDFYESGDGDPLRKTRMRDIELKVYRNEKVMPAPVMGFSEVTKDD